MSTADDITRECNAIRDLLIAKNHAYGDSALNPVRVFSRANPVEQILVRIDDKISRLSRGNACGEDVEQDLLGYLVLLRIARKRAQPPEHKAPTGSPEARTAHITTAFAGALERLARSEAATSPLPGDVVPWTALEDGCVYHDAECRSDSGFVGRHDGRWHWLDSRGNCLDVLLGGHGATHAICSTLAKQATLVARGLGTDPEQWRAAMRAYLAR